MAGRETSGGSLSTLDPGWSRCGVAYLDTRRRRQTDEEGYWDRPTPVSPSGPPESLPQPFEGWAIRRTAVSPTGTRRSNLGVARARRPNGRYWRPHFKDSSRKRNRAFLLRQHDHGDCSATALEDARAVCVDRGVRLTPTHQRVMEIIWQGRRPLGAYEILEVLSGKGTAPRRHGLSCAGVPGRPRPRAPAAVSQRLRRLLSPRPFRRGAVSAVYRVRYGGGDQRLRYRKRDRARRGSGGLRLPGPSRRDQRALPALSRRLISLTGC